MATSRDLLRALDEFEATPESRGYDLRLSLSALVLRHLSSKGWTQKQLAEKTGMKESFITRIIHADSNCTFEVAGRILHALGVAAEFREVTTAHSVELRQPFVITTVPGAEYEPIPIRIGTIGHGQRKAFWTEAPGAVEREVATAAQRGVVSVDTAARHTAFAHALG